MTAGKDTTIRVSAETWRRLQAFATPFRTSDLGTPDKVISHLLDVVENTPAVSVQARNLSDAWGR